MMAGFAADLKRCSKCGLVKSFEAFSKNKAKSDGLDLHCRACIRARIRNKKARHFANDRCIDCGTDRGKSHSTRYCVRCFARNSSTASSRRLRSEVLRAYGGENLGCRCCGEQGSSFLTLDHVDNGGRAHRRRLGNQGVYHELRRQKYPSGFQVLCFNCNVARGYYGACPHVRDGVVVGAKIRPATSAAGGTTRHCTRCGHDLPLTAFYADRGTRSGLQSRCRACTREASLSRLKAARLAALAHYSSGALRCACCGEREIAFLALDHVTGDGPRMPGARSGGNVFFAWLQREAFPPGLQVLCHNCNCAKRDSDLCPHVNIGGSGGEQSQTSLNTAGH